MKYLILLLLLPCFTKAQIVLHKYDKYAPYSGICSYGRESLQKQKDSSWIISGIGDGGGVGTITAQTAYNKDSTVYIIVTDTSHYKVSYIGATQTLFIVDGKPTYHLQIDPNCIDSIGISKELVIIKTKKQ